VINKGNEYASSHKKQSITVLAQGKDFRKNGKLQTEKVD
jgi:hypothetical protein